MTLNLDVLDSDAGEVMGRNLRGIKYWQWVALVALAAYLLFVISREIGNREGRWSAHVENARINGQRYQIDALRKASWHDGYVEGSEEGFSTALRQMRAEEQAAQRAREGVDVPA